MLWMILLSITNVGTIQLRNGRNTSQNPAPEPETPQPTQLDKIQTAQLTIMAAMADQYEESLEKDLRNMDVQATIYEAILELGGAE